MAVWNRDLIIQKIDKVLGDTKQILTALSGGTGAVKSVQRGTARFTYKNNIPAGNQKVLLQDLNIVLSAINPQKSIVILNGAAYGGSNDYYMPVYVHALSQKSLTLKPAEPETHMSSSSPYEGLSKTTISWQVIEFY